MHAVLRFTLSIVLVIFTLLPGLSAADPDLRDQSLSIRLVITECQDADTPAMIAKAVEWSYEAAPIYVRIEEPDSREQAAIETAPPRATLVPGLLLFSLRWSSDT